MNQIKNNDLFYAQIETLTAELQNHVVGQKNLLEGILIALLSQ